MSDIGTFGFKGFGRRGFDLPAGSEVAVGPEGRARLRYNEVANQLEVSLNAAAYVSVVGAGGSSPWTDTGTLLHPSVTTRSVVVGASALSGTEQFRVVGDSLLEGAVEVDLTTATAGALNVHDGVIDYMVFDTSGPRTMTFGDAGSAIDFAFVGGGTLSVDNALTVLGDVTLGNSAAVDDVDLVGQIDLSIRDNDATALRVHEAANDYFNVATTDGSESITIGNPTTNPDVLMAGSGDVLFAWLGAGAQKLVEVADAPSGLNGTGLRVSAGDGGVASGGAAGNGSNATFVAGDGGDGDGANPGGTGGTASLIGGFGGLDNGAGFGPAGPARCEGGDGDPGGDAIVVGGQGLGGGNGGTAFIRGGPVIGGGDVGNVVIGDTTTDNVNIGTLASSVSIRVGRNVNDAVGFFGTTPQSQNAGWTVTNHVVRKTWDTTTVTLSQLAEVVGTIAATLSQNVGSAGFGLLNVTLA